MSIPDVTWLELAELVTAAAVEAAVTVMLVISDIDLDIAIDVLGTEESKSSDHSVWGRDILASTVCDRCK